MKQGTQSCPISPVPHKEEKDLPSKYDRDIINNQNA